MDTLHKAIYLYVFSILLITTGNARAANFPANPVNKPGYTIDFQEEFNETTLDTSKWSPYYLPHYAPTLSNAAADYVISNGVLKLKIEQNHLVHVPGYTTTVSALQTYNRKGWHYLSGIPLYDHSVNSFNGKTFHYGYFEIRAKLSSTGGGGHQAWWMVGDQTDDTDFDGVGTTRNSEIDIIETFFSHGNSSWQKVQHPWTDINIRYHVDYNMGSINGADVDQEFHIYAMEWKPSGLYFYFDNKLVTSWTRNASPNYPMGMVLSIYTGSGSGQPNGTWPKQWEVDYVRVWQPTQSYPTNELPYYRIKNRQHGTYLNDGNSGSALKARAVQPGWWSAQWQKVPTDNSSYFILRNRHTGREINIPANSNGDLAVANLPDTYWSAQWREVSTDGYVRLESRFITDDEIRTTNQNSGNAQHGNVPTTYWDSQWTFELVQ